MLLVITRAVHIGACMILLSLFAFEILVARPALRETDRSASPHMEVLREQFRLLAVWSGFAAIVSGIVWFWIVLARMTGGSLWEMPSIDSIGVAITQTQFGRLWTWRLSLMLLFTIANLFGRRKCRAFLWSSRAWQYAGLIIATTLLASITWAGHAGATIGAERPIHLTVDSAHLIAAGLWPGGLLPLTLLLVRASRSREPSLLSASGAITRRFSAVSLFVGRARGNRPDEQLFSGWQLASPCHHHIRTLAYDETVSVFHHDRFWREQSSALQAKTCSSE
jgi:putative copper resistance protein D